MTDTAATTRWSTLIFLFVWLLSAIYVGLNLNHGWDPHDEGTLGQSAERVLHGEMPHRDFDDPYTGGLAYIDALIFKVFGVNLFWLRLFLFVCFLAWVPAIYVLAREFLSPWPAGAVTLIAVAWSVPNYTAAMPSWFNLFFATFGTLALAKYIRKPAIRWLILAGLCGGLSFLIKSIALYYIAGALLFFVYREQSLSRIDNGPPRRTPLYLASLTLGLSAFVLALTKLVFTIGEPPEYLHFVFPGAAIALLLLYRERTSPTLTGFFRLRALLRMAIPFLVAASVPMALFLLAPPCATRPDDWSVRRSVSSSFHGTTHTVRLSIRVPGSSGRTLDRGSSQASGTSPPGSFHLSRFALCARALWLS
jgi:hypothetical protein